MQNRNGVGEELILMIEYAKRIYIMTYGWVGGGGIYIYICGRI